ncbi:hypothetical protein D3C72_2415090 [compost metagenome]
MLSLPNLCHQLLCAAMRDERVDRVLLLLSINEESEKLVARLGMEGKPDLA